MAKDAIHDSVKNALRKDGWAITAEFLQIEYEELEISLILSQKENRLLQKKTATKSSLKSKLFLDVLLFAISNRHLASMSFMPISLFWRD